MLRAPSITILRYRPLHIGWQNGGMDIRERINAVIKASATMSVRNVSLAAGLSDSALHKFLTGSTVSLTLDTVDKLAEALGVDPAWLAYGEGSPERATKIAKVLERISEQDQERALAVLEAFARTGTDD